MTTSDSQYYSQALKFFVHEKRVPVKRILTEADISRSRFYAYINGAGDLAMTRLLSILNVLNINLNDFLLYARLLKQEACQTAPKDCLTPVVSLPEQLTCAIQAVQQGQNYTSLIQVLKQLNQTQDLSKERQQMQSLLSVIEEVFSTTVYYTVAEIELFIMVMPHLAYEQLKTNYPKAKMALTQRLDVSQDATHHLSDYLVEMQYKMMMRTLQNQDISAGITLASQILALPTGPLDWHAQLIKKMVTVVMAVLQNQGANAQILYSKLVEMIYFIQPTEQWLGYEKLLYHDFKHFRQVILATD